MPVSLTIHSYFKPVEMLSNVYQDGAMRHNNPTLIARAEASKLFPANMAKLLVISVGCGRFKTTASRGRSTISRLKNSLMAAMDPENQHQQDALYRRSGLSGEITQEHLMRLNPDLDIEAVSLDDVKAVDSLKQSVERCASLGSPFSKMMELAAHQLVASLFYVDLSFDRKILGRIYARLGDEEEKNFFESYRNTKVKINDAYYRFESRLPLCFSFTENEALSIELKLDDSWFHINGSPYRLRNVRTSSFAGRKRRYSQIDE